MNALAGLVLLGSLAAPPGNPGLTAKVEAHRWGRVITLDFQTLDADGQRHADRVRPKRPPEFIVSQNGCQVGSGTFEYG
jgi:hypothetical protein